MCALRVQHIFGIYFVSQNKFNEYILITVIIIVFSVINMYTDMYACIYRLYLHYNVAAQWPHNNSMNLSDTRISVMRICVTFYVVNLTD